MSDDQKYLSKLPQWTTEHASLFGLEQNIEVVDEHLEVLLLARDFYGSYGFSPSMRPLCKTVAASLGVDKGRSIYLNKLFSGSPAKTVAYLAGLPKPKNCL
ncbi:MAG: TusE/DsrC/DsvC family sulfur relay protein [Porticoccaceae bacterium]|jgi:tRNA 2-thiouridine synthesizing protein E|nr:TusE/DsrC/DsvC family sulfur relay protein [Porticoccaceae bacterium]|tara:strand:- start:6218 stop:6520 length:303 start_codon:yes stop_codon:yes gene_type:complete